MRVFILSVLLFFAHTEKSHAHEIGEFVEFKKIISIVKTYFKVFGNSRGCVSGPILNYTLKKLLDPEIQANSLCLNDDRGMHFNISWSLDQDKNFTSKKLKTIFAGRGVLKISLDNGILKIETTGLKYKVLNRVTLKIRLLKLNEFKQHIELSSSGALFFLKLSSSIDYFIKNWFFEYLYVLGIKFKL